MTGLTKAQRARIVRQLEKAKAKVAAERDGLRELIDEVEDLEESWGRAIDDLDSAIQALSELV